MAEAFSVADVGYVHRIIVGNDNPEKSRMKNIIGSKRSY